MKQLYSEYNSDVQFFFVYGKEAHPIDSDRPKAGTTVEQPITTDERLAVAKNFLNEIEMPIPALLDKIDNKTGTDYAAHPDRLYLVGKDGRIAWAGSPGPKGFVPDELRQAIVEETGSSQEKKSPPNDLQENSNAVTTRAQAMFARMPVHRAIDANQDGEVSADELENAPAALRALDQNDDGRLDLNELRPQRRQRSR